MNAHGSMKNVLIVLATTVVLALPLTGALPGDPPATYHGAGTVVVASSGAIGPVTLGSGFTIVDVGLLSCHNTPGGEGQPNPQPSFSGNGGACIPFGAMQGNALLVTDNVHNTDVAFQVCVDIDGDSLCTGPTGAPCGDQILFSHDTTTGAFHNPLFVLPLQNAYSFCGGAGFPGYIVILCAGAHQDEPTFPPTNPSGTHTHEVTAGTIEGAWATSPASGDFCGAPTAVKAYSVD